MIISRVQVSVFCNHRIEPIAENISYLMTELEKITSKTYLPSVTTVQNIDMLTNQIRAVPNLLMKTADQSSQITCMDNRIDSVIIGSDQLNPPTLESYVNTAVAAISIVLRKFNVDGNRLALNVYSWGQPRPGLVFKANEISSHSSVLAYYTEKELFEWSSRVNTRVGTEIRGKQEILNVLTDLSIIRNEIDNMRRLQCLVDINTIGENTAMRFNPEDLSPFCSESVAIANEIINDVRGK